MKVAEALKSIRSSWLNRVSRRLARGEELRESTGLATQSLLYVDGDGDGHRGSFLD